MLLQQLQEWVTLRSPLNTSFSPTYHSLWNRGDTTPLREEKEDYHYSALKLSIILKSNLKLFNNTFQCFQYFQCLLQIYNTVLYCFSYDAMLLFWCLMLVSDALFTGVIYLHKSISVYTWKYAYLQCIRDHPQKMTNSAISKVFTLA